MYAELITQVVVVVGLMAAWLSSAVRRPADRGRSWAIGQRVYAGFFGALVGSVVGCVVVHLAFATTFFPDVARAIAGFLGI